MDLNGPEKNSVLGFEEEEKSKSHPICITFTYCKVLLTISEKPNKDKLLSATDF